MNSQLSGLFHHRLNKVDHPGNVPLHHLAGLPSSCSQAR
jgi:hypothetical protein